MFNQVDLYLIYLSKGWTNHWDNLLRAINFNDTANRTANVKFLFIEVMIFNYQANKIIRRRLFVYLCAA